MQQSLDKKQKPTSVNVHLYFTCLLKIVCAKKNSEYKLNQNNMKLKLIQSGINMHQHCGTTMVNLGCMAMGKLQTDIFTKT